MKAVSNQTANMESASLSQPNKPHPGLQKPMFVQSLRKSRSTNRHREPAKTVIDPKSFRCGHGFNERGFPRGQTRCHREQQASFSKTADLRFNQEPYFLGAKDLYKPCSECHHGMGH